jgi:protease IV
VKKEESSSLARKFWISLLLIVGLLFLATILAAMLGSDGDIDANTAVIKITGPISGDSDNGIFAAGGASSTEIVRQLEKARDDDSIEAVILEINSPGGSAVASDEIAQAVKEVRAQNKTVVAWIRESGASGAYWIASSADYIVANRMSITGSIGVISSYLQFDRFIADWNVSYNRLISGDNKDIGDPFVNLTNTQRAFLQSKLNRVHGFFIDEVARNRNMSREKVVKLADGSFFLGVEAKENGLIDTLGGKNEAIAYIEQKEGIEVSITEYEPESSLLDILLGVFHVGPKQDITSVAKHQQLEEMSPIPLLR